MMDIRRFQWGLLSCLLLLLAAAPSAYALEAIGSVEHVEAAAFGTPPGAARRDLVNENSVHRDEMVETLHASEVSIVFVDGTRLSLRENSAVVLDEMIFDPNGPDTLLLDLGTGLFQFISGAVDKEGVTISAASATIGIRGTNIEIQVAPDGTTTLGVREGVAVMTPAAGGAAVEVAAGQTGIAQPGMTSISVQEGLPDFMEASLPTPATTDDATDRQHASATGAGTAQSDNGAPGGGSGGSGGAGGTGDGNGTGGAGAGNGNGNGSGQGDSNGNAGNGNAGNGNGQGNGGNGNGNGNGNGGGGGNGNSR